MQPAFLPVQAPARVLLAVWFSILVGCGRNTGPLVNAGDGTVVRPPMAQQRPHAVVAPSGTRVDPYYWLRDDTRETTEVLGYLNAENAYADALLANQAPAREVLYAEMVGRLPEADISAPVRAHGYDYFTRYMRGGEHPVLTRRGPNPDALEEVLLDGNQRAQGQPYFRLGQAEVSDDATLLAWSEDVVGRSMHVVHFKDLRTGALLSDELSSADDAIAWAADGKTLLYIEKDPETLLGVRVKAHVLGSAASSDRTLYEEADHAFFLSVSRSPSRRFLFVQASSTLSDEQLVADAKDPSLVFRPILARSSDHLYEAEDHGDAFIVRTNQGAPNYRIVALPMGETDLAQATELVAEPAAGLIESMAVFDDALAFEARVDGLLRVCTRAFRDGGVRCNAHAEPVYTERLGDNEDPSLGYVQVRYSSLTTPESVYHQDLSTGARVLVKRDEVRGGFDPAALVSERLLVRARDGVAVPVSLVYRKGHVHDGSAALYLTGYGAYGLSEDPVFSSTRLSLLERGVVFGIAHVRGGQELGRAWYEAGRVEQKAHTFTDFIDVTAALVAQGVAHPGRVAARGASAGGLLIGAVANMAPEKYRVLVAHVPFVDVVTTMLDDSIPLTTNEYDEWGNPAEQAAYARMLSYSPYDNVAARSYPALYVSAGLWDSQVQYYEPAKWVAKLRANKTDAQPLVLRTNMEAGHSGRSGRFARRRELAEELAFVLGELGVPVR
jgi:oligopeptidase B